MTTKKTQLKDCAEVLPGFSSKTALVDEPGGTLQVIVAKHLTAGEPYHYHDEHRLRIKPPRSFDKYLLHPGDILFMSRGILNRAVLLEDIPQPAIAPLSFFIIRVKKGVLPAYLAWCLNQPPVEAQLNEIRTGAGTPMIPRQNILEICIPMPPLETQTKIAALAALQQREKSLQRQLTEDMERLHRLTGRKLFNHLITDKKE